MAKVFPLSEQFAGRLNQDGEFRIAARYWTGGFRFRTDDSVLEIAMADGVAAAGPCGGDNAVILEGPEELWAPLLQAEPARHTNDLLPVVHFLGLELKSDPLFLTQYFSAIARIVELLRPDNPGQKKTVNTGEI
jgi:hypothetical protein